VRCYSELPVGPLLTWAVSKVVLPADADTPVRVAALFRAMDAQFAQLLDKAGSSSMSDVVAQLKRLYNNYTAGVTITSASPGAPPKSKNIRTRTRTHTRVKPPAAGNDDDICVRSLTITPTRQKYEQWHVESANRAIRTAAAMANLTVADAAKYFLRVKFTDENMSHFFRGIADSIEERIFAHLTDGVLVAGDRYELLGWSSAMLKERSCWLFCGIAGLGGNVITANELMNKLGDFSMAESIPKAAARFSQCFSDAVPTTTGTGDNIVYMEDVWHLNEGSGQRYNFSDGVGTISEAWARAAYRQFCRARRYTYREGGLLPSALQIRCGGVKGVVSLDVRLKGKVCMFRDSMKKFDSKDMRLEVCRLARPRHIFLNRQLITCLSSLGIPYEAFDALLEGMQSQLSSALTSEEAAVDLLRSHSTQLYEGLNNKAFCDLLYAGFDIKTEPFLRDLLRASMRGTEWNLVHRTRIRVPDGALLMGVMDEYNILRDGEVYLRCIGKNWETESSPWLSSTLRTVVVTRSPCLHPGDVRVLQAVPLSIIWSRGGDSAVHYFQALNDVLVFPQVGERPHPNQCSGGDLDGDDYAVFWDKRLIPQQQAEAMSYTGAALQSPREAGKPFTASEFARFFVDFHKSNILGWIATAHMALADDPEVDADSGCVGAFKPSCMELAALHSTAVDFQKTGVPAVMLRHLVARQLPDFMATGKRHKPTYKSESVIGKLFRKAQHTEVRSKDKDVTLGADATLFIPGRELCNDDAKRMCREWAMDLGNHMHKFGIQTEAEAFSGNVHRFKSKRYRKCRRYDAQLAAQKGMRTLLKKCRASFRKMVQRSLLEGESVESAELRCISALYEVSYGENEDFTKHVPCEHCPTFRSLPWVMKQELCKLRRFTRGRASAMHG
jgi:RNA-dependent RNA polymerase